MAGRRKAATMSHKVVDQSIPPWSQCVRCLAEIPATYYMDGTYDTDECPNGCDDIDSGRVLQPARRVQQVVSHLGADGPTLAHAQAHYGSMLSDMNRMHELALDRWLATRRRSHVGFALNG